MAKRDAHGAEELLGVDGCVGVVISGIPVGNGVFGVGQFVAFSVGELELLIVPATLQFTFGGDSIDALVVQDAAIVLEEGSVLSCHIYQHGRESVGAAAIDGRAVRVDSGLCPQGRLGASCIAVAGAAGIACIYGSQAAGRVQRVIIEAVASIEALLVGRNVAHPVGIRVIGKAGVLEHGGGAGRQRIAIRHLEGLHVQHVVILAARQGCEDDTRENVYE